jgi:ferredoxin
MKIEIDRQLCELHAQCAFVAPELFRIENDAVVVTSPVPDTLKKRAITAAKVCPQLAIKLLEE